MCGGEYLECLRLEYMRKHTRKQHERVSIFNIHVPVVEWRAAVSIKKMRSRSAFKCFYVNSGRIYIDI